MTACAGEGGMKGFVFVSGRESVLRFLASDAFAALEAGHELIYVVQPSDLLTVPLLRELLGERPRRVEWVAYHPGRFRRWRDLFDVSCALYQDRSPSFRVRYRELTREDPQRYARLEKLVRPGVYERHREAVEERMGLHPEILSVTLRERPDFFVLPSALLDAVTDDVLQIAAKLSIPTLLLVAGWDNPSSKGLVYHHPTLMGVWGEQSLRHAVEVQGLDPDRVHVVGAPHYERYRASDNAERHRLRASWGATEGETLALFGGTLRLFDETQLLREVDEAIEFGALPSMRVIYRPHPYRDSRSSEDSYFDHAWRHVILDPDMEKAYRATKERRIQPLDPRSFLGRLHHLTELYRTVDVLICPMSTILLEAMLFGVPVMAVAFGDGKHSWSADKASRMLHFQELYEVPGIIVCRDRSSFFADVRRLVDGVGNRELGESLRASTRYFVYQDGRSYAERLASLVDVMLSRAEPAPAYGRVSVRAGRRFRLEELLGRVRLRKRMLAAGRRLLGAAGQGRAS